MKEESALLADPDLFPDDEETGGKTEPPPSARPGRRGSWPGTSRR